MFDRTNASRRLTGTGPSKFRQMMQQIADEIASKKMHPLRWATVIGPGAIAIDVDGYSILSESNDYINLTTQHYRTGDRVLVLPIEDERGTIFVFGRPNPVKEVAEFYAPGVIDFYGVSGTTTSIDISEESTVSVSKVLSKGWLLPASRLRVVGRTVRNGGTGKCTVEVVDEQNGVIGSVELDPDGSFDIAIDREDITDDNQNIVSVQMTYDDAAENTATISRTVMLLGEP